jgi:hypothetical protein
MAALIYFRTILPEPHHRPLPPGFLAPADEARISMRLPLLALFGRDRRVGECLLLREERKSGLRGPISVFDPISDVGLDL